MPSTTDIPGSVPFNQAYWVEPGRFMAGCYPGAEHSVDAQDRLKGLLEHGIRHIINLMESAPETDQQIELVCSWRPGE